MNACEFDAEGPPYEFVPVEPDPEGAPIPEPYRERILIQTVHDGDQIPAAYRLRAGAPRVDAGLLQDAYARERDWGANRYAACLAAALGLPGYHRVRVARVLLDFNRFPGATPPGASAHLDRLAINPPFTQVLDHDEKVRLLEEAYDRISDLMEQALRGKLITLTVHTYDERNPSRTQRPHVSLITRCVSYQDQHRMPFGVFDPLYPDVLGETTCSRILHDRISLNLERSGFRVGHNHPYLLPEGSIEVRTQVWYFFSALRRRFELARPHTCGDPAYEQVWSLLLNTNLRQAEAELLRGYLHRFRRVAPAEAARFGAARRAYEDVASYLGSGGVLDDYRYSPERPSSLAMEVRKDLLCTLDPVSGLPTRTCDQAARAIARVMAGAITTYLQTDREIEATRSGEWRPL